MLLSSVLYALPFLEVAAEDDIGSLIQGMEQKETGGTEIQAPTVEKQVNVESIYTSMAKPVEKESYTGKKISLDLQDADVVNVLRLLADVGGVNIVFGSDVSGKITVNLKNIPWDQALDIVLMTNGLDKVRMGDIIRVAKSETITDEANKRLAATKASDKVEPMTTRIIPVNYSDIKTIKESELIKNILSERGKIDIDERTNTLIINDIKRNVEQIEILIKRLDTRIPQVLIEARIVEATDTFAKEFGIQWGIIRGKRDGSTYNNIFGGNTSPNSFLSLPGVVADDPQLLNQFNVNLPATDVLANPGAIGFNLAKFTSGSTSALDVRLSAAEAQNLAKVISAPRVMTVDNKKANIIQGEDIPYLSISQNGTQVQFVEANLQLIVTPHVTAENTILLELETHRDAPNFETTVQGQPAITRNKAETSVLLNDGETTVIGGIYVVEKSKVANGIPGLMDLPYIGKLFRYDKTKEDKKELLVFITPKIIR
ncbi:MAG: type IV pilus secretin PilQ [bacterium]